MNNHKSLFTAFSFLFLFFYNCSSFSAEPKIKTIKMQNSIWQSFDFVIDDQAGIIWQIDAIRKQIIKPITQVKINPEIIQIRRILKLEEPDFISVENAINEIRKILQGISDKSLCTLKFKYSEAYGILISILKLKLQYKNNQQDEEYLNLREVYNDVNNFNLFFNLFLKNEFNLEFKRREKEAQKKKIEEESKKFADEHNEFPSETGCVIS